MVVTEINIKKLKKNSNLSSPFLINNKI